jgi:polysaccharide export outer membrane protein
MWFSFWHLVIKLKHTIMDTLNIFVVDDDKFMLHIIEQHLMNLGVKSIKTFQSGPECLEHLNEDPDIIFLDYDMNLFTGYEVLKKIKRVSTDPFVVMVSGQKEVKPAVDSLKHGAFDYLQKDKNLAQNLKHVIQKILDYKDLMQRSKPSFLKSLFHFL